MKCANERTTANWSGEANKKEDGSFQDSNDEENSGDDVSTTTDEEEEWKEDDNDEDYDEEDEDDMSELAERRMYGKDNGRNSDKTAKEENNSGGGYKDEEEDEEDDNNGSGRRGSKAAEEGSPKRLASALRSSKKKVVTKHSTEDNEVSDEQEPIILRGGGREGNSSDEEQDSDLTEMDKMKTVKGVRESQKSGNLEKNRSPAGERTMSSPTAGGDENADSEDKGETTGQESVRKHMGKISIKEGEVEKVASGCGSEHTQEVSQVDGSKKASHDGWGRVRDGSTEPYRTKIGTWEMSMRILGTKLRMYSDAKIPDETPGMKRQKTEEMEETEDTGQGTQARKTQGEVILTESRAEND